MKSFTIGITGASGVIYAQRLLIRLIENPEVERVDLVISQAGVRVISEELGINAAGTERRTVAELLGTDSDKVVMHPEADIGA